MFGDMCEMSWKCYQTNKIIPLVLARNLLSSMSPLELSGDLCVRRFLLSQDSDSTSRLTTSTFSTNAALLPITPVASASRTILAHKQNCFQKWIRFRKRFQFQSNWKVWLTCTRQTNTRANRNFDILLRILNCWRL